MGLPFSLAWYLVQNVKHDTAGGTGGGTAEGRLTDITTGDQTGGGATGSTHGCALEGAFTGGKAEAGDADQTDQGITQAAQLVHHGRGSFLAQDYASHGQVAMAERRKLSTGEASPASGLASAQVRKATRI